jgi:hypothetical protein
LFQRSGALEQGVWDKMMRGLSTRNYGALVKEFTTALWDRQVWRENFIKASLEKMDQLLERPLGELPLCTVLIDGTLFKDRHMIAALGIGCDGRKTVWPGDVALKQSRVKGMPIPVVIVATLVTFSRAFHGFRSAASKRCSPVR